MPIAPVKCRCAARPDLPGMGLGPRQGLPPGDAHSPHSNRHSPPPPTHGLHVRCCAHRHPSAVHWPWTPCCGRRSRAAGPTSTWRQALTPGMADLRPTPASQLAFGHSLRRHPTTCNSSHSPSCATFPLLQCQARRGREVHQRLPAALERCAVGHTERERQGGPGAGQP